MLAVGDGASPVLLILRALGLGDFLTGVPAYRALAEAFPDHRILLAAPAVLGPLAALTGVIDELLTCGPLEPLPDGFPPPDVAVNLHGKGPQSHRILLTAGPGRMIAFESAEIPETAGAPHWRAGEHEVHRWTRLLREEGVPCDPTRLDLPVPEIDVDPSLAGTTIIHPGAASRARRWPVERWAEVARSEMAQGRNVVVTGGPHERELANRLAALAGLPPGSVLAGSTDVLTMTAVVAGAARVLCADTGVAHLATATGTPSVVLFGPTSPSAWGPPPDRPWHRPLWTGTLGDPLADLTDRGLLQIQVEDVLKDLDCLPDRPA